MAYSGFRDELAPTQYPRDKTPATVDYSLAAVISAFIMLYISLLCILPGFRGKQVTHDPTVVGEGSSQPHRSFQSCSPQLIVQNGLHQSKTVS